MKQIQGYNHIFPVESKHNKVECNKSIKREEEAENIRPKHQIENELRMLMMRNRSGLGHAALERIIIIIIVIITIERNRAR